MALNVVQSPDGRRQRTERSQAAIIEAALALMDEGILVPTAQQIADRAGVGIRSFFRHFEDMDSLFSAADTMLLESYEGLFAVTDRSGAIEERVLRITQLFGHAFDQLRQVVLSTRAQLWRSAALRERYARHQRCFREELENWLPELSRLSQEGREAAHAVASFDMWYRLRGQQKLSRQVSVEIVAGILTYLINAG